MFADSLAKALKPGSNPTLSLPTFSFTGALRNNISTVTGSDYFGPNQPLAPIAPKGTQTRNRDYEYGWNLLYRPRSEGNQVSFQQLRWVAQSYDLLRSCIETRKDQIAKMPYDFTVEEQAGESK